MKIDRSMVISNAFRLNPKDAEHFSDIIADAMLQESRGTMVAGSENIMATLPKQIPTPTPAQRDRSEMVLNILSTDTSMPTTQVAGAFPNIGKTSVRAALHQLEMEGLVEKTEVRGALLWRKKS